MKRNLIYTLGLTAITFVVGCQSTPKPHVTESYGMLVEKLGLTEEDLAKDLGLDFAEIEAQVAAESELRTKLSPIR